MATAQAALAQAPAPPATPAPAAPAGPAKVDVGDPAKMEQDAGQAWEKGDWATAAANYEALLAQAKKVGAKVDKLEPLYFILGAAWFNLPDHTKAQAVFNEYVTTYPKGANVYQANLALARILRAQKKWAEAIPKYEGLKTTNALFKDDVNIELAECYLENNQKSKSVTLLETALAPGIKTAGEVRQALKLCDIYQAETPEKGVTLLERVKRSSGARPLVNEINFTALKLADQLMTNKKEEQALQAFQNLRSKDEVVATLKDLAADYDRTIERLAKVVALKGPDSVATSARLDQVRQYAAQAKAQVAQLEKEQNYDAVVYYRISRCFAQLGRYWEARLGFQWLYDQFPAFEDRPTVLFGLIVANARLAPDSPAKDGMKIIARTEALCRDYLKTFPTGANLQEVSELLISMVQKSKDQTKINQVYDEVMKFLENSPNKANFLAVQVQNYLEQYEFGKAREAAEKFRSAVPDSPVLENVDYMYALTFFFQNDYGGAIRELGAYSKKYPNGQYTADARYRLAMMVKGEEQGKKAKGKESNFKKVLDECQDIIKTYPNSSTEADCLVLIGDTYQVMGFEEQKELGLKGDDVDRLSADSYLAAADKGRSDAVVEYSMSQARPMLVRQGRWKEVEQMYQNFLKANPDSRSSLEAISWIAKSMMRQGTSPEEKAANEDKVKKFLAEQVLENINNPSKEGVEDLLQQLAKSCIPKKKPRAAAAAAAAPAAGGEAAVTAAAAPAPALSIAEQGQQAEAALDQLLSKDAGSLSKVGQARVVYVKSELYKVLERGAPKVKGPDGKVVIDNSPKKSDQLMEKLVTEYTADDLSPRLLATVAEYFQTHGGEDRAVTYYNRLIQFFPQSPFMDWGLTGLAKAAYKAKDYDTALKRFNQAIDEYPGAKYYDAVIGKARILFDTDKYEDCEKMVKELFGDKSVPKEVMAEATWLMGEIKQKQKLPSDAFNFFQRLYLSYKAFPAWAAKGYLRAGQMKEDMGKGTDAIDVYKAAVNDPKMAERLKTEPDFIKVQERLRALGG